MRSGQRLSSGAGTLYGKSARDLPTFSGSSIARNGAVCDKKDWATWMGRTAAVVTCALEPHVQGAEERRRPPLRRTVPTKCWVWEGCWVPCRRSHTFPQKEATEGKTRQHTVKRWADMRGEAGDLRGRRCHRERLQRGERSTKGPPQ